MHIVVAYTNIIVSSLIGKSFPFQIVRELILKKKVVCALSEEVLREYTNIISYAKFSVFPKFRDESIELIEDIESVSILIKPRKKFSMLVDKDDNKFLDLAYSANADFLITGNSKHFPYGKFENTEIISPQKYWATYWK